MDFHVRETCFVLHNLYRLDILLFSYEHVKFFVVAFYLYRIPVKKVWKSCVLGNTFSVANQSLVVTSNRLDIY